MAEIRLTGINKVYPDGTHAVIDVDLTINDGEFMIMVGPSGCAKSTILRMIAGLEVPTSGTVEIGGRTVNDVAPKDRDIAMVFQSYALYPHMSVAENMAFGLKLRKMDPNHITQRINEAAQILGLEELLHRKPKQLSGGQRQRVAMGRAIVREPQAFLMDEPLSNLDAKLRVQMRTEIAKLHRRLNTTTVYVTHDQVEAMTLGQRICILRKGIVQQVDTPHMVYTNPSNIFVGGFIGSPGMNFVNGTLSAGQGVPSIHIGDQDLILPESIANRLTVNDIHGRTVVVGIRPEHLSEHPTPGRPQAAMMAQFEIVEIMGSEAFGYCTLPVTLPNLSELADAQGSGGTQTHVVKLNAITPIKPGSSAPLYLDLDELHIFDAHTQQTLLVPRADIIIPGSNPEFEAFTPAEQLPVAAGLQMYHQVPAYAAPPVQEAAPMQMAAPLPPVAVPVSHGIPRPKQYVPQRETAETPPPAPGFGNLYRPKLFQNTNQSRPQK